jgi:hypothetical protein
MTGAVLVIGFMVFAGSLILVERLYRSVRGRRGDRTGVLPHACFRLTDALPREVGTTSTTRS